MIEIFEPSAQTICFRVTGEMKGQQVQDLYCAWVKASAERLGKTCIVDLSAVTFFDHDTCISVMRRLIRDGTRLKVPNEAVPCLISVVYEEQERAAKLGNCNFCSSIFTGDIRRCGQF